MLTGMELAVAIALAHRDGSRFPRCNVRLLQPHRGRALRLHRSLHPRHPCQYGDAAPRAIASYDSAHKSGRIGGAGRGGSASFGSGCEVRGGFGIPACAGKNGVRGLRRLRRDCPAGQFRGRASQCRAARTRPALEARGNRDSRKPRGSGQRFSSTQLRMYL